MKRLTGAEAMKLAHEQYGEAVPRTVTGNWLKSRIRADFSRPGGGLCHGDDESWDALADIVNGMRERTPLTATEKAAIGEGLLNAAAKRQKGGR